MSMNHEQQSRRDFLKTTSAVVAGAAMADATSSAVAASAATKPAGTASILNYNPRMGYRRLGKTELMLSEVSLGGHGGKTVEDRRPVLERAIELGINYLDTNIVGECELYARALGDKRNHFHIGFASWPEKLTTDYEKELSRESLTREIEARLRTYKRDMLDLWRPVGATWGPGQTAQETMLDISPRVLDIVVDVFEKVRRAGKVRFLGISAHNPTVFRRVMNDYPQFSVILFPYMFLTKPDPAGSLLDLARKKDVGVIAIKPFAAGATFVGGKPITFEDKVDPRASSLLKAMLREKRISAIIPGVTVADQLNENVKASYERGKPLDAEDKQALRECEENFHASLPSHYQWLCHWKTV